MAGKKYKCDNGHEFSLGEFDDRNCPDCDSEILTPVNSNPLNSIIDYFKSNKIISLSIGIIILVIIIVNMRGCGPETEVSFNVTIDEYEPNIKGFAFHITKITTTDGVKKTETMNVASIADYFNFTVNDIRIDASEFKGTDKNIYYPCKPGLYNFKWVYSTRYPHKSGKMRDSKPSCEVPPNGFSPNEEAKCSAIIKITNVFINDCDLVVSTNFDTIKTKQVLISIHGKNGPFEKRNRWNISQENLTKFDIYYAIEEGKRDTTSFVEKVNQSITVNCKVLSPAELSSIRQNFIAASNDYGNHPDNKSFQANFNNLIKSSQSIKIKLNGTVLNGESELYNTLKTNYENDGTIYKIVITSVIISAKGAIESFEFVAK